MELFANLGLGFAEAFQPFNLMFCFVGVLLGTAIGILPGIGPLATISMLLPLTFGMEPTTSLIMLAGIYYGSQYGGSTTAILVNLPGEAASTVTTIDGYQMALKGRAGVALAAAGLSSFFAGCVATVLVALVATPLPAYAGRYRDPWYGDILVTTRGKGLHIDFLPTPVFKSALEPWGPDTFRTRFPKGAGEDATVTFAISNRKVTGVTMKPLSPLADFSYDFQHLAFVPVG